MSDDGGAAFGFTITPVFVLLSDLVAAAPAGDWPYEGELDEELVEEGDGTALWSLTPFSRVTGLELPSVAEPVAPFDPLPLAELLPAAPPELPPPDPPPDPPPPPWPHAGTAAAIMVARSAAKKLVRMEISYDLDKATFGDTFRPRLLAPCPNGCSPLRWWFSALTRGDHCRRDQQEYDKGH